MAAKFKIVLKGILFLCIGFTVGCANLSSEDMNCALKGKLYSGHVETGGTVTDVVYSEDQTTIRTSPEYVSTCRSPETEEEKARVKEMKNATINTGIIFFSSFGAIMVI